MNVEIQEFPVSKPLSAFGIHYSMYSKSKVAFSVHYSLYRDRLRFVRGCEKFVPALAYLFCLALPGSHLARFAYLLAGLCSPKAKLHLV